MKQNKTVIVKKKKTVISYDDTDTGVIDIKEDRETVQKAKANQGSETKSVKTVSYRIGKDVQDSVSEAAKAFNVQKSDLVRFLITNGLEQLESGKLALPVDHDVRPRKLKI